MTLWILLVCLAVSHVVAAVMIFGDLPAVPDANPATQPALLPGLRRATPGVSESSSTPGRDFVALGRSVELNRACR